MLVISRKVWYHDGNRTRTPVIKMKVVIIMNAAHLVAQAQRQSIIQNLPTLCYLLHIDTDMPVEEQLAELVRVSLFSKAVMVNPWDELLKLTRKGEYDKGITDEEYEAKRTNVKAVAAWFHGRHEIKPFEFIQEAVMNLDPDVVLEFPLEISCMV